MNKKSKRLLIRLSPFVRSFYKILSDAALAFVSFGVAAILQRGLYPIDFSSMFTEMAVFALVAMAVFTVFKTHRAIWRYTSVSDLVIIGWAVVTLTVVYFGTRELTYRSLDLGHIPFSQPIINCLVLLALICGQRVVYRLLYEGGRIGENRRDEYKGGRSRILLVGAGQEAELFIRSIRANPQSGYDVVGIVDNRNDRKNRTIHGVPVLGRPKDMEKIIQKLAKAKRSPQRIIFTETVAAGHQADTSGVPLEIMTDKAEDLGLKFARLPRLTEFKDSAAQDGEESLEIKPIAIEDLLGRPQATIKTETIKDFIKGKRVLITGAGGSIGSELSNQIASFEPAHITLLDNSEYNLYAVDMDIRTNAPMIPIRSVLCNIRNRRMIESLFQELEPEIVFHAAALKHVPLVEMNPCEGILTNVAGTRNVAEAALACKAQAFVQISTDKAVNPTSVMGASKRIGEYFAQALDLEGRSESMQTRFITVRFGNVLGSSGSVVPLFKKQLQKGGPLTVTHPDIKRYFMTVNEAVSLVLQASAMATANKDDERGRIMVLDMGEPMRIVDVAKQMIRLADRVPDKDIKIVYTGLRPGEKLYEELFDSQEVPIDTKIPSTLAAVPQPIALDILRKNMAQLEELALNGREDDMIRRIGALVPGFVHDGHKDLKKNLKEWQNSSSYA